MSDPRASLRRAGLQPKKSFGQNFLVAPHVVDAIARACVPDADVGRARVVELGAGTGALTRALVARAAQVVAVERDRDLVPVLEEELAEPIAEGKLRVVEGDAQAVSVAELLGARADDAPRVLAGNLPYQITGSLIERAVRASDEVDRVVFMVQLEVAERLVADAGTKDYGALSVFVQAAFRPRRLLTVSPGSFHPPPNVTSAVVVLEPERPRRAEETETFRALVKGAFGARRKTLRNAWGRVADADVVADAAREAGIALELRGETLDVDAYARMAAALSDRLRRRDP